MIAFLFRFFRFILSLRYRIQITGIDYLHGDEPLVVFPNHPALIDPVIVSSYIGKYKTLAPVVTETYYHTPGIEPILDRIGAVPVGDVMAGGSIDDVRNAFIGISDTLKSGKNILLYPSGHVYVQPFEHIVGKKMAYEIVGNLPKKARIVTVRTRGLWGSMFSKAYTGESPVLSKLLGCSIAMILANLVFFMPRRTIMIEIEDMTTMLRKWHKEGLEIFNKRLQDHYNRDGNEECGFIPHYFYHNDTSTRSEPQMIVGSVAEIENSTNVPRESIPDDICSSVISIVAKVKEIDISAVSYESNLITDIYMDSLDMAETKALISASFEGASNPPISTLKTVADLCVMAIGASILSTPLRDCSFVPPDKNTPISLKFGGDKDTILSCILDQYHREQHSPFIFDALSGSMTRDEFITRSYIIGEYLRGYKNDRIGIMLPAVSVTSILIVGTYIAGKLPVMLNWTVGEKSFAHCMDFAHLDVILTSRSFYEQAKSDWMKIFEPKMIFVEDIISNLTLSTKIKAILKKKIRYIPRQNEHAVMLYTSGSESLPKAVLLTHHNLICDIAGALELVPFSQHETIMGFLPPFHSFGFTISTIFPLIAPIQVSYSPNPGDARSLGEMMEHTGATIVPATPTFLRMILSNTTQKQLSSVRYAFVGAEKCSDEIFNLFSKQCPNAVILEGYGITECSPIVAINPISSPRSGSVGKPLSSIRVSIRDLSTHKELAPGEQGMIYLSGSSIFAGYIDSLVESPFDEFDGIPYYKTGDLGYLDSDGYLIITGRLKRFVKIAGEMISLPFVENILLEKYGSHDGMTLAIEALETQEGVIMVAFTTFDTTTAELEGYLRSHGVSNLIKINHIHRLEIIPILGTGKTDYKYLKSLIIGKK